MPAGDLVTLNRQLELEATLMGTGSDFPIDGEAGAVSGLFTYLTKMAETDYAHADGSFVGDVFEGPRSVTAALLATGTTAALAGTALATMRTTWAKSSTDQQLWFQVDGIGKGYVVGRAQGITPDESWFGTDTIPLLARFRITDPVLYDSLGAPL